MDLADLLLEHFRATLVRVHEEALAHDTKLGVPPSCLIVTQREPSEHRAFNTGAAMRQWKVDRTGATEMALTDAVPEPTRQGMYHDVGRGDFSIHDGGQRVRVGWSVGPRYGRGYDLLVEPDGKGTASLVQQRNLWVS